MSVGSIQPFLPVVTATISASATSANAAISGGGESALIYNASGSTAFVAFGTDLTVTATTAGFPVPAGASRIVTCGTLVQSVAIILSSGSGTVYVSRGSGTVF